MPKSLINNKVTEMLTKCSVQKLLDLWNETERQQMTAELAKTRGWIMDALQAKNPEAFDAWMEAYDEPEKHFA